MNFLIITEPDDAHAIVVKMALETMELQPSLLFSADQPTLQKNSIFIDNQYYFWNSVSNEEHVFDLEYDAVWWRRPRKPYIPKNIAHASDYEFINRENLLFYESFTTNIAPNAWWVNPKEEATRANFKLFQLRVASQCDIKIPITLFSNDPHAIRYFLLQHQEEGTIYKPLCSNVWREDRQVKVNYTAKINFQDLPSNHLLQLTPGIFQRQIKKKYELRVCCFGNYLVAAKLNSQTHPDGQIDWRAVPDKELIVEPYTLPDAIAKKIRQFMQAMGLVFGSLDMIVTPEGEYVFLEVNEQGQFLWLEEYNPDFKILDIFIQFLIQRTQYFEWQPKKTIHRLEHYINNVESSIIAYQKMHVDLNNIALNQELL